MVADAVVDLLKTLRNYIFFKLTLIRDERYECGVIMTIIINYYNLHYGGASIRPKKSAESYGVTDLQTVQKLRHVKLQTRGTLQDYDPIAPPLVNLTVSKK
jgi:hypothetical protein